MVTENSVGKLLRPDGGQREPQLFRLCYGAVCPLGVAAFQGALAFQGVLDASAIQLLEPEARFARSITSIQI